MQIARGEVLTTTDEGVGLFRACTNYKSLTSLTYRLSASALILSLAACGGGGSSASNSSSQSTSGQSTTTSTTPPQCSPDLHCAP
jgi:hypothetical protein